MAALWPPFLPRGLLKVAGAPLLRSWAFPLCAQHEPAAAHRGPECGLVYGLSLEPGGLPEMGGSSQASPVREGAPCSPFSVFPGSSYTGRGALASPATLPPSLGKWREE